MINKKRIFLFTVLAVVLIVSTISIVLAMLVMLLATSAYVMKRRVLIRFGSYNGSKDYEYDFCEANANIIKLNLNEGKLVIPLLDDINQTAFVRVRIQSTLMGKYFEPHITMTCNKKSAAEYFECGAVGVRYLNISSLITKDTGEITFNGKYIALNDQVVELILYTNESIAEKTILIVAPHPDDAELAAYGLYSSCKDSYIVTVTAGDSGARKYDEIYQDKAEQFLQKGRLRTWNSITVPLLGGIPPEQSINLGFFDGTLKSMYKDKTLKVSGTHTGISDIATYRKQNISSLSSGLHGESNWNSLVGNFEYLLNKIKPDIIVTPYPALESNDDHIFSSIALFEAIKKADIKKGRLYLYANHLALSEYYPYGEMGGAVSLPPNFDRGVYFEKIYSLTLSAATQKDKLFALEAMNDIRPAIRLRPAQGAMKIAIGDIKRAVMGKDGGFYRKSVRENELFFVIKMGDVYNDEKLDRIIGKTSCV